MPKLLIQPLVENAVLYGIESTLKPGRVEIDVYPSSITGLVRVEVRDNGPGIDEERLQTIKQALNGGEPVAPGRGAGVGLINVYQRLRLYFGRQLGEHAKLTVESEAGAGTVIRFEIPRGTEAAHDS
jgi:two-component system sensor histidine kinase YesM